MGTLVLMIGIPGSGKTTITNSDYSDFDRISLDDITKSYPHGRNKLLELYTCDDLPVPPSNNRKAEHVLVKRAFQKRHNVVIDDTNLTKAIRILHMKHAAKYDYEVHAVAFCNFEEAISRNKLRHGRQRVPDNIMKRMQREFEWPNINEGFKTIRVIF